MGAITLEEGLAKYKAKLAAAVDRLIEPDTPIEITLQTIHTLNDAIEQIEKAQMRRQALSVEGRGYTP